MITHFALLVRIVLLIDLIYLSVCDIKTRYIPVKGQIIAFSAGVINFVLSVIDPYFQQISCREKTSALFNLVSPGGLIAGFAVLSTVCVLIAVISGGLGGGDVKIFSAIGLNFGLRAGAEIMMVSFVLSGLFCGGIKLLPKVYIRFEKLKNVKEIPLLPFITISSLLQFI